MNAPRMHDFDPLPGLSRMETLQRAFVLFAVLTQHSKRYKRVPISIRAASDYIGIHTDVLYRLLRLFEAAGHKIEIEGKVGRFRSTRAPQPKRKHYPNVRRLLKRIGVPFDNKGGAKLWLRNPHDIRDVLLRANAERLRQMKALRPDLGQGDDTKAKDMIEAWRALRRIFERKGYSLHDD